MKTRTILFGAGLSLLAAFATSSADTVELKNGSAVQGTFAGGTATTINMQTPQGVMVVQTADIATLKFGGAPGAAAAAPAAAPVAAAPAPAPAAGPVTIPAGTVLTVRMDTQVSSNDPGGKKFTAKLVADLMAGSATIVKAGTAVMGQVEQSKQAGRLAGKSQLAISLTGINLSGQILPIMTTNFAEAGKGEFRKTARNATAGAVIGNAIEDDDGGGKKGAAVGVGVSLIKKGDSVTVPPGAILEFRLTQPVSVTAK